MIQNLLKYIYLIILFAFFLGSVAWAGIVANPIPEVASKIDVSDLTSVKIKLLGVQRNAYLSPNESVPARMLSVTNSAPEGVYLGVGTERCLMTAAINPQLRFLILADYDPRVVLYNQINLALIRLAESREDYVKLRLLSDFEDWQIRLKDAVKKMDEEDVELLQQRKNFDWWVEKVRNLGNEESSSDPNMLLFQTEEHRPSKQSPPEFKGANYLFEDHLFQRVHQLAKSGAVQISWVNFAKIDQVGKIVSALNQRGMKLSILDLSNAWWPCYEFGFERIYAVLTSLRPITTSSTLFLGTTIASLTDSWSTYFYSVHFFQDGSSHSRRVEYRKDEGYPLIALFTYFGAHFESLFPLENWKQFERNLLEWKKGEWPLSNEVERIDAHLLPGWRMPALRSQFILHNGIWRILLN